MVVLRKKKYLPTFLSVCGVSMFLTSGLLWAQSDSQTISVRSGLHKTHTRLVFDATKLPPYELKKLDDGQISIVFNDAAALSRSDDNYNRSPVISDVSTQGNDDSLSVTVGLTGNHRFRQFTIGNRLVVDVFVPEGVDGTQPVERDTTKASVTDVAVKDNDALDTAAPDIEAVTNEAKDIAVQQKVQNEKQSDVSDRNAAPKTPDSLKDVEALIKERIEKNTLNVKVVSSDTGGSGADTTLSSVSSAAEVEYDTQGDEQDKVDALQSTSDNKPMPDSPNVTKAQKNVEKRIPAGATDRTHVLSVSVTERVGVAAFERAGWFWFVFDEEEFSVRPTVSGPREEEFPAFEAVEAENGTAYRMRMPESVGIDRLGQGGGLVWRVYLGPSTYRSTPLDPKRVYSLPTPSLSVADKDQKAYLLWPALGATKIVKFKDPTAGDTITAVTVSEVEDFIGPSRNFVDVEVFRSTIGLAFRSKTEELSVELDKTGVKFKRPDGFKMSRRKDVNIREIRENVEEFKIDETIADNKAKSEDKPLDRKIVRIFDFNKWNVGGIQSLQEKQKQIFLRISDKDDMGVVEDLLTLAKMNLANNRAQEAMGFLHLAESLLPEITDSVEFKALEALSLTLARRYEYAFIQFGNEALAGYGELDYWRSYVLAWLEDWQQAQRIMPLDLDVLKEYPTELLERIGIKLAEVALRNGKLDTADSILTVLTDRGVEVSSSTKNGIQYLTAVIKQLEGNLDEADEMLQSLMDSDDDFYRARAGLALILMKQDSNSISVEKSIDLLEGLRFTWRGDEIEARILFSLGKFYIEDNQYIKGLAILRDAAGLRPDSDVSKEIARSMKVIFEDLILVDEDITALEATSVFEEFRELTPVGKKGQYLTQRLAERMVEADLLGRAASLLQFQVDFRLSGKDKAKIATRLATIYLLDRKNDQALGMLDMAQKLYTELVHREDRGDKITEITMLRAQALFQKGQAEEALDYLIDLEPTPAVNKLRADIAWQSSLWADAAEALNNMMLDQDLYNATSLTGEQSDLVLNRAVALNLGSDRVELASMRNRFLVEMNKTANARLFDVVTRPRQTSIIAGEDTLDTLVNEVSIFSDFMDSYRKNK